MADERELWAVVGLGNPGKRYVDTCHNAGFIAIDRIFQGEQFSRWEQRGSVELSQGSIGGVKSILMKPQSFMNRSGEAVQPITSYYKIPNTRVCVVYDELDFDPGVVRIRMGGSAGGHNGIRDLIRALGGDDFYRVRVGIGHPRRIPGLEQMEVSDYVLSNPRDREGFLSGVGKGALAASLLLCEGLVAAQQKIHGSE